MTQKLAIRWDEKTVKVEDLKPFEHNPRRISKEQFAKLKASIIENGYSTRIKATTDNRIIGGHQRLRIFKELGITEIPVLVPERDLTDEEFIRNLVTDNINHGEHDFDVLANLVDRDDLLAWGMLEKDLGLFDKALNSGMTDENEIPELSDKPIAKTGDLWLLGNHRLICGDSTNATDVERLLNGVKPNLMVTDPPYGVEYDPEWRNRVQRADGTKVAARAVGKVENDDKADWSEAWALFPGNIAYVWHGMLHSREVFDSLTASGFKIRAEIVWAKSNFVISRGDYHPQHESCWYAVRDKGDWKGDRKQTTVWQIDKPQKSETGHSTQKPVECMRKPVENNSSEGQAVYEPFCGSGTTIIACEQTNRFCFAVEISPAYVDVIIKRWQNFTGNDAILEATGQTFRALEAENGRE